MTLNNAWDAFHSFIRNGAQPYSVGTLQDNQRPSYLPIDIHSPATQHIQNLTSNRLIAPLLQANSILQTMKGRFSLKKGKQTVPQVIDRTRAILQDTAYCHVFSESEKQRLIEVAKLLLPKNCDLEPISTYLLWCKTLRESKGSFPFNLLLSPTSITKDSYANFIRAIQILCTPHLLCPSSVYSGIVGSTRKNVSHHQIENLEAFAQGKISLADLISHLEAKLEESKTDSPEKTLDQILKEFTGGVHCKQVKFPLTEKELKHIQLQYLKILEISDSIKKQSIAAWTEKIQEIKRSCEKKELSEEGLLTLLAIGREAIRIKFQIFPNTTQMLAILGILAHPVSMKGRLSRMVTGDGKSPTIALLAFVWACQGEVVDLIMPTRYLAKRDCKKFSSFFKEFSISTSHICVDHPPASHFSGQVIYGTNFDFEFAFMHDQLEDIPKRGNRPFHVAIVDEGDNLLLDCSLQSARMSIPLPSSLNWVYGPIFHFVRNLPHSFQILSRENYLQLRQYLSDCHEGSYKNDVKSLTDRQLGRLVASAFTALHEKVEGRDYKIKDQKVPAQFVTEKQVVIVDWKITGREKEKSRWQGGVHQFLEVKHNLRIHDEGGTVSALSHPIYFSKYQRIYGFSGTLGNQIEREEMRTTYLIDSFDVPPHNTILRKELPPLLAPSREIQYQMILAEIKETINSDRPILILWESVQESIDFANFLQDEKVSFQLLNECQPEHEEFIVFRAGLPKMVTIATNIAGRGTNIVLDPKSNTNGGLYVILSFFPDNERVQDQGFGRGGRYGQPGTCRLILNVNGEVTTDTLAELYEKRRICEEEESIRRLAAIEKERKEYKFLEEFWKELRALYAKPHTDFTVAAVKKWLARQEVSPSTQTISLDSIQELVHGVEDFHGTYFNAQSFGEKVKSHFANMAQQQWAKSFYNVLSEERGSSLARMDQKLTALFNATKEEWQKFLII